MAYVIMYCITAYVIRMSLHVTVCFFDSAFLFRNKQDAEGPALGVCLQKA